ncbi:coiled-coil domain-containing protein 87 [Carcharodon carcharias]|uniref:coiled-coil domain-containing protein 87 n=1 Tax=Carcharodon carcharias TaxID=13397 RepID=UPI001B7E6EF0|nr:coiled-coil domain-containing protein 87 [Carcharodon carcharias]
MTKSLGGTIMEVKSNKLSNKNGLYSMVQGIAAAKELHQRYKDILEPLSLFTSSTEPIKPPVFQLKRPVTPIDQSVQSAPASLTDLCQLIQRRIAAKSEVMSVSIATQQALGGMIVADVKLLWEEFVHCAHDITLTNVENKELSRRITTHIITVCEQLFLHYLQMVDIVRQRFVFTDEANLSRLKAQLTLDCTKYLNIPAIKRRISREIKALRKPTDDDDDDEASEMEYLGRYKHMINRSMSSEAHFSLKYLFNLSRPKKTSKPQEQTIKRDLQEINENMPSLDKTQVYNVLPHKIESAVDHRQMKIAAVRTANLPKEQKEQYLTEDLQPEHHASLKNFQSNSNLSVGKSFTEEQDILCYTKGSQTTFLQNFSKAAKAKRNDQKYLSIADDLQKLLEISTVDEGDSDPETTLPPLIQALTYDNTHEIRKHKQEKILMELEEEEKKEKLKKRIQQKETEHAQPATVSIKVSKRLMARTADVRISDRMFMDPVYLQTYPTVYNHIEGEIDSEMVKQLDDNLSHGDELQEIYKELLNAIPDDYLLFDQDPVVASPAMDVDLSKCFASLALSRKKSERAINPELKLLKSKEGTERYLIIKKEAEESALESVDQSKNVFPVHDYLNYISTQGTDYLGVAFHLYDSEDEGDEARKILIAREAELKRKDEMEIAEMRLVKEEFTAGSWNINTVMIGGLGKEPPSEVAKEYVEIQKQLGKVPNIEDLNDIQNRLQCIWTALRIPDSERLDMAIKYSSHKHKALVSKALEAWETAVKLIKEREYILSKLEQFERFASNPNRFFAKGYWGTSSARLKESKERDKFYSDMSQIESQLSTILKKIKNNFEDVVTFKGRPYIEKMQRDKVEMLYWLQQERRKCILQRVSANRPIPPKYPPLQFSSCCLAD